MRLSNNSSNENSIYCEDILDKADYIDTIVYQAKAQVSRKTKTKITNGTLHGLTYHIVKVPQRE